MYKTPDVYNTKILRAPQVLEKVGMGRTWLYSEIAAGRFPAGIKIGPRARGWTEASIEQWLQEQLGSGDHG